MTKTQKLPAMLQEMKDDENAFLVLYKDGEDGDRWFIEEGGIGVPRHHCESWLLKGLIIEVSPPTHYRRSDLPGLDIFRRRVVTGQVFYRPK